MFSLAGSWTPAGAVASCGRRCRGGLRSVTADVFARLRAVPVAERAVGLRLPGGAAGPRKGWDGGGPCRGGGGGGGVRAGAGCDTGAGKREAERYLWCGMTYAALPQSCPPSSLRSSNRAPPKMFGIA